MALCFKCNRMLSANGSCLYCGTPAGAEVVGDRFGSRPGRLRKILIRVLVFVLVAWAAHFLFFTEVGHSIIKPIRTAIGM